MMLHIYDYTEDMLKEYLVSNGEKPFRAKQLMEWLYRHKIESFDEISNMKKDFIEKLKNIFVKSVYNPEWRCLSCGKEIFDGQKFCQKCLDSLPYNDRYIW